MKLPKQKTFVYLRRSQDREDRQMLSIEKQDREVKIIIQTHNLAPHMLPPEERSARYEGRPIFNDMIARLKKGEANSITVWQLSRLSRNPIDAGRVIDLLDRKIISAIYTPSRVWRNTPEDKAFLAIELAFAKKNNDDLSKQVIESFIDKRNRGEYPGPAPLGYYNAIIGPRQRNIVPEPVKGPLITQLFVYASEGTHTLNDVTAYTNDIGLLTLRGNRLAKQTVKEILQRRAYTGVFKYGSEDWVQGTYQPLVTVELFERVQHAMGWKTYVRRNQSHGSLYAFKGLFQCTNCGHNLTAYTAH